MKISELIEQLQEILDNNGDNEIYMNDNQYGAIPISFITYHEDVEQSVIEGEIQV